MVSAWAEVIDKRTVPTDRLNDAYLAAIRVRELPGMLTPMEVVAAWRVIAEAEAIARRDEWDRKRLALLEGPRPLMPEDIRRQIEQLRTGTTDAKGLKQRTGFTTAGAAALRAVPSETEG